MSARCPECQGERIHAHPAGGLVFEHARRCALLAAEDARKAADSDLLLDADGWEVRPITDAERTLLGACGAPADSIPDRTIVSTAVTPSRSSSRIDQHGVPIEPGAGRGVAVIRRSWVTTVTGEPRALDPDILDPSPSPDTTITEETTA